MKQLFLYLIFLFLFSLTFGQTQLLKGYDFNKGGYYILGAFSTSDRNSLRDSLGEFYTDDIVILNQFKKEWVFKKPGEQYACGYHYTIYVCAKGEALEHFSINLNCEEIVTQHGYFYFNPNKLRQFYGKLKKPENRRHTFSSIQQAREFRTKIVADTNLIMAPNPNWNKYEGYFQFTYECTENSKDCNFDNEEKKLEEIALEIKKIYPNEIFELENAGGSSTSIFVRVTCDKSLSDKFNLYNRDTSTYFGKWTPYQLTMTTYWKPNVE